jgi:Tfp pilus assembly protein PilN
MKRFNLMPKEVSYADGPSISTSSRSRDFDIVLVVLPIILALAIVYFLQTSSGSAIKGSDISPAQLTKLQTLQKEYQGLLTGTQRSTDASKLIEERNRLKNNLDAIRSLNLVKSVPLDLLIAIGRNISERVALTTISKKDNTVWLEGVVMDNKSLSEFMEILVNQNVFKNINIKSTQYSDEFGPYKQKFTIVGVL